MRGTELIPSLSDGADASVLVGNKRLVDLELLLVLNKKFAPVLRRLDQLILLLYSNQKASLKVQQCIQVEEYRVRGIARNSAGLLNLVLE